MPCLREAYPPDCARAETGGLTMAEYITKEAAIEEFEWGDADVIEDYGDGCDFGFSRGAIKSAINSIPAADVAPVVHAEWVVCGDGDNVPWMCSHCGKTTAHKYKVMYGKYCPHCGAKMDGGEE